MKPFIKIGPYHIKISDIQDFALENNTISNSRTLLIKTSNENYRFTFNYVKDKNFEQNKARELYNYLSTLLVDDTPHNLIVAHCKILTLNKHAKIGEIDTMYDCKYYEPNCIITAFGLNGEYIYKNE